MSGTAVNISGKTRLFGILGYPVEHSVSPGVHNAAFRHLELDMVYLPLPVKPDDLGQAVAGMVALGFVGANVTIPHKEAIIPLLDELAVEARLIGAVNTLVFREGKVEGHNTDGAGFLAALEKEAGFAPQGKVGTILGAGGAARAVAVALAQAGAREIYIANRTPARAVELATHVQRELGIPCRGLAIAPEDLRPVLRRSDLVVNASPVGMYPHVDDPPLIPTGLLEPGCLACDLIYNPSETAFLRGAHRRGCRTLNGLGMLVYQGALSFELWTGRAAPVEVMRAAALAGLQKC